MHGLPRPGPSPRKKQKPEAAPVFLTGRARRGLHSERKRDPAPEPGSASQGAAVGRLRTSGRSAKARLGKLPAENEKRRALREEATLQAVLANSNVGFAESQSRQLRHRERLKRSHNPNASPILRKRLRRLDGSETQDRDLNRASEKRDFLKDRGPQSASQNRLAARREEPSSAFELKAGTIIPATMIGGVSSDLPAGEHPGPGEARTSMTPPPAASSSFRRAQSLSAPTTTA